MAVFLSPVGGVAAQFFTNSGIPLTGGKLYTYAAGTTTPVATYTSSAGGTAHTNPIILDSAGRVATGEIWLLDNTQYKFVLKDANDILIGTYDNIRGINGNTLNFTAQEEIQTATAGQTVFTLANPYVPGANSLSVFVDGVNQYDGSTYAYVETNSSVVTFAAGLHVGALVKFTTAQSLTSTQATTAALVTYTPAGVGAVITTVQNKLREYVSVLDYIPVTEQAAIIARTSTYDCKAAITAALAANRSVFFPAGQYCIASQVNFGGDLDAITGQYNGRRVIGDGVNNTYIKALPSFTDSYMFFIGNPTYATDGKYSVGNELAWMTIANENMTDDVSHSAVGTFGTYNNDIHDLQIGVFAYPATHWDLSLQKGTYTTTVSNVHGQQFQCASSSMGDLTTIAFYNCSCTFLNISGGNAINFDHMTLQGNYSGVYPLNRVQISNCANISFVNGDLEGDGVMFSISNCIGILLENNNIAMPGSYTKSGSIKSIFARVESSSQIKSRGNIFMNWIKGPLAPQPGTYLYQPGVANFDMQFNDFNGDMYCGAVYAAAGRSVSTGTTTIIDFATKEIDSGTKYLSTFDVSGATYTYTPLVTTGASWAFVAPLVGVYNIQANIFVTGLVSATDAYFIAVYVGGVEQSRVWGPPPDHTGRSSVQISFSAYTGAGGYFDVRIYSAAVGSIAIDSGASVNKVLVNYLGDY